MTTYPIRDYTLQHVFDAGGHTGKTYYYRIMDRATSKVVHATTHVLTAADELTWAESAIFLTEIEDNLGAGTGSFPIIFFKEMPGGTYEYCVYEMLGGSPANTDDVAEVGTEKHGGIFGF